jgi:hypothetical protein
MPSSAPAANVAFPVEAISGLQRLRREMARLSQGDENYESKKARSSDCYSRTAENDFCNGVMSAGRSYWRVALASA